MPNRKHSGKPSSGGSNRFEGTTRAVLGSSLPGGQNQAVAGRKHATVLARARRSFDHIAWRGVQQATGEYLLDQDPVVTRCADCSWTYRGSVEAAGKRSRNTAARCTPVRRAATNRGRRGR